MVNVSALVAPFVYFLVKVFETPPAVEVVPEIVESLDFLLGGVEKTQEWNRLYFAEPSLAFEHRSEGLEERVVILAFQLSSRRCVFFERLIMRINRVELPPTLRIRENVHGLLDAFEKRIVVGLAGDSCLFIGVMFKHFLPIYMEGKYSDVSVF